MATVVAARRSTPRLPGAKLCVADGGLIAGSVSGGCVEGAVIEQAQRVLAGAPTATLDFGWSDEQAWDVGLPCGGEISVRIERWGSDVQLRWSEEALAGRHVARVVDPAGEEHLAHAAGALGADHAHLWDRDGAHVDGPLLVDVALGAPRLVVFGAIDVADHLITLARGLGWRSWLVDPRSQLLARGRFAGAEATIAEWPVAALGHLPPIDRDTAMVVLSHQPSVDDAALQVALRSKAWYIGAMGSRRMQADRRRRLLESGVDPTALARLRAPVGLDLGGVTPAEMALSIMAEMVAVRRGRSGGALRDTIGSIRPLDARELPPRPELAPTCDPWASVA